MILDVIIENEDSAQPDQDGLVAWADTYGLNLPVLADQSEGTLYTYASGGIGLPYKVLLNRGMEIVAIGTVDDAQIDELLAGE